MNKKYYTTKYKAKADCIMFLSGENYMIFDDKRGDGKIYSFINSEKIQNILIKTLSKKDKKYFLLE